jgi:ataxin-3
LQQQGNLCAQHALNALLQGPFFSAVDLADIAHRLDVAEQNALTSGRISVDDHQLDHREPVRVFF